MAERRVKTPEGVKWYGLPIGAIITAEDEDRAWSRVRTIREERYEPPKDGVRPFVPENPDDLKQTWIGYNPMTQNHMDTKKIGHDKLLGDLAAVKSFNVRDLYGRVKASPQYDAAREWAAGELEQRITVKLDTNEKHFQNEVRDARRARDESQTVLDALLELRGVSDDQRDAWIEENLGSYYLRSTATGWVARARAVEDPDAVWNDYQQTLELNLESLNRGLESAENQLADIYKPGAATKARTQLLESMRRHSFTSYLYDNGYETDLFQPDDLDLVLYSEINSVVKSWALSSYDENPSSIGWQMHIRDEFGVGTLRPGQPTQIATQIETTARGIATDRKPIWKPLSDAMYAQTQEHFKAAGITEVKLYRGMGPSILKAVGYDTGTIPPNGVDVPVQLNPLSSWATTHKSAMAFKSSDGALLTATVAAEDVFTWAGGGQGCLEEDEVVLLGRDMTVRVTANDWSHVGVVNKRIYDEPVLNSVSEYQWVKGSMPDTYDIALGSVIPLKNDEVLYTQGLTSYEPTATVTSMLARWQKWRDDDFEGPPPNYVALPEEHWMAQTFVVDTLGLDSYDGREKVTNVGLRWALWLNGDRSKPMEFKQGEIVSFPLDDQQRLSWEDYEKLSDEHKIGFLAGTWVPDGVVLNHPKSRYWSELDSAIGVWDQLSQPERLRVLRMQEWPSKIVDAVVAKPKRVQTLRDEFGFTGDFDVKLADLDISGLTLDTAVEFYSRLVGGDASAHDGLIPALRDMITAAKVDQMGFLAEHQTLLEALWEWRQRKLNGTGWGF